MSVLPPFAVIFGPTAGGKTEALSSLHHRFERRNIPIELVSADSMQVYRGMDIGTAKPAPAERSRFPHHLIDIRDPDEGFDVGEFVRLAGQAIRAAAGRGAVPIVSGGTAFYIRALLAGLPDTPVSDPQVRAEIEREMSARSPASLYEELAAVDPASAERIAPNDRYRIARALEVYRSTGRPRSSYDLPVTIRGDRRVVCIGLARERPALYEAVNGRVDEMFRRGLRTEVEKLVAAGYRPGDPGLRAIGYREFFSSDDGGGAPRGRRPATEIRRPDVGSVPDGGGQPDGWRRPDVGQPPDAGRRSGDGQPPDVGRRPDDGQLPDVRQPPALRADDGQPPALRADEEVIPLVKRNTRRYAKRQSTFFRRMNGVTWIDSEDHASLYERVSRFMRC